MAYKGWIVGLYDIWESNYRNALKRVLRERSAEERDRIIRPKTDVLGDIRRIRNDLVHKASSGEVGTCKRLRWFNPGEKIVLTTDHVFDFLNQVGVMPHNGQVFTPEYPSCILMRRGGQTLLDWKPEPKIISVLTHDEGRDSSPITKGLTVVFENGLYRNMPFSVESKEHWDRLGNAEIRGDFLCFEDGTCYTSKDLYRFVVEHLDEHHPGPPIGGPFFKIAEDG